MKSKFIIGIVLISLLSIVECKLKHLQKEPIIETNDREMDLVKKLLGSYKQVIKGGEFTKDDPFWLRDEDDTDVPYEIFYLDVTKKGTFTIQNSDGVNCPDIDSYLYLYDGIVNVKDYEKNIIETDDDSFYGCSVISETIGKGMYTVVQTLYDDDDDDYLPYTMMIESNDGEARFSNCPFLKPTPKVFGNFQQCLFPPKDEMECFDIRKMFQAPREFNHTVEVKECSSLYEDKYFKRTCTNIPNKKEDPQYTFDKKTNQLCVKRQACKSAGKQDMCIRFYEIKGTNQNVKKCDNAYTIMVPGNAQSINFKTSYCH